MEGRRKEERGRDLPDLCETASYAPALTNAQSNTTAQRSTA